MPGEGDLAALLRGMSPRRNDGAYVCLAVRGEAFRALETLVAG